VRISDYCDFFILLYLNFEGEMHHVKAQHLQSNIELVLCWYNHH
jgi:hypothetical protein